MLPLCVNMKFECSDLKPMLYENKCKIIYLITYLKDLAIGHYFRHLPKRKIRGDTKLGDGVFLIF
jgi:hypothetical protein